MVRDDPDCKEKQEKGGDGVDTEDEREAGHPEQHGVEAGVDAGAEHGNGEGQAAAQRPYEEYKGE